MITYLNHIGLNDRYYCIEAEDERRLEAHRNNKREARGIE
jgi:hypothetical protein